MGPLLYFYEKKKYLKQNILPAKMNNKLLGNWLLALKVTSLITHKIIRLNKAFREWLILKSNPIAAVMKQKTFIPSCDMPAEKLGNTMFPHGELYGLTFGTSLKWLFWKLQSLVLPWWLNLSFACITPEIHLLSTPHCQNSAGSMLSSCTKKMKKGKSRQE